MFKPWRDEIKIFQLQDFKSVTDIFGNIASGDWLLVDVDDTLITPQMDVGNLIDDFKARFAAGETHLGESIANWRMQRQVRLVHEDWPTIIRTIQNTSYVLALTQMDTGKFATMNSIEKWRYEELQKLGFNFSQITELENFVIPHHDENKSATGYKGIFFTGGFTKAQVLDEMLDKCLIKPFRIIFVDDRHEHVNALVETCKKYGILYYGIHYTGAKLLNKETIEPDLFKFLSNHLENTGIWLEQKEARDAFRKYADTKIIKDGTRSVE